MNDEQVSFQMLLQQSQETEANSIMPSSRQMYTSSLRTYERIMTTQFGENIAYPIDENKMRVFIEYARTVEGKACNTLLNYIASFAWYFNENSLFDRTKSPSFKKYRTGLSKMLRSKSVPNRKLPLTKIHLQKMGEVLNMEDYIEMSIVGTISLMYYGFLRASEMTQLRFKNLVFNENSMTIHINFSKTDVTGFGCDVEISKTDYVYDPYCIFMQIIQKFGPNSETKLWPLTIDSLRNSFKGILQQIGVQNYGEYSLHSCRRGGATAAAAAGVQDCQIKSHGRWLSNIYQIYTSVDPKEAGIRISAVI